MNTKEIIDAITQAVMDVENGDKEALPTFIKLKKIENVIKFSLEQIKPQVMTESMHYEKVFNLDGCKVERKSGGGTWKYDNIQQLEELKNKTKYYQELAKSAAKSGQSLIIDGGEVIEPAIFMSNADTIAVTIIEL